jgi:hypothetical protein
VSVDRTTNAAQFRYHLAMRQILLCFALLTALTLAAITTQDTSSSSTPKHTKKPTDSTLDSGTITNSVYRNKPLALACKIPEGWVLRTDEMNTPQEPQVEAEKDKSAQSPASAAGPKVLLAAFSRPPEARAEDVNSSILIAAEPTASYPGLKDAAQYFGPLTEVAKAQGFTIDEDPYEIALGTKTLVRGDFHKNVGSRVMHQSTLAMLSHGYAISITIIAGAEDDVEELIDGLTFSSSGK